MTRSLLPRSSFPHWLVQGPTRSAGAPRAFTLTELLVVMGLIAMLASLLMPVVRRARQAANAANCLSNLRQMGTGWTMYTANSHGHLMHYAWRAAPPMTPDFAWNAYWPGILHTQAIRGDVLLCPSAAEISTLGVPSARGYGGASISWSGRPTSNGTPIRFNNTTYRDGSYGINRYLTLVGGGGGSGFVSGFGSGGQVRKITGVRRLSEVPLFMDCMWVDARPDNWNGTPNTPAEPPPNLLGDEAYPGAGDRTDQPEHWLFLIARHGRGINVCMADGSARWVRLEETYRLKWRDDWTGYSIPLPRR